MKANLRKGLLVPIAALFLATSLFAQEEESSNFSFSADLVSRYIWRGANLGGNGMHIQPGIEYAFGNSGLAIGAWGSHSIGAGGAGAEADLYLTYSFLDMFSFGVTDYYFPSDAQFARDGYFNYKKGETGHVIELMAGFDGTENIPISVLFAVNVYGLDGTKPNGDPYYAKYLELGYSKSLGDTELSVFAGAALDDPEEEDGAVGWYGNSAGIVNLGFTLSKSVSISDQFQLPLSSSLIFNPEAENIYLVFGLSF